MARASQGIEKYRISQPWAVSAWLLKIEQEIVPGGSFVYMMCFSVMISAIIDGRTPAGT
jgi:hypothetical protein